MFHYVSELHSYNTRSASSGNFRLNSVRITVGKRATFISYIGPKIWNHIEIQAPIKSLKYSKIKIMLLDSQPVNYDTETLTSGIMK